MALVASFREMKRAGVAHRAAESELQASLAGASGGQRSRPAHSGPMLLFYAVECGLKAVLMKRRRFKDTSSISVDDFGADGHDLRRGLRQLCAAQELINSLSEARTAQSSPEPVPPNQYHQAWRYGIDLDGDRQAEIEGGLRKILGWIQGEL